MSRTRPLAYVPPVVALLMDEFASGLQATKRRGDKGFLKDLRQQASWSVTNWPWADQSPKAEEPLHLVAPSAAMNPLMVDFKCLAPPCRLRAAQDFGRFVTLYTDGAVVTDYLTDALLAEEDHVVAQMLLSDVPPLMAMLPVIEAGLLRFASPVRAACASHRRQMERVPDRLASLVMDEARSRFRLRRIDPDGVPCIEVANPFLLTTTTEELVYTFPLSNADTRRLKRFAPRPRRRLPLSALKMVASRLHAHIASTTYALLWQMRVAEDTGATMLAGCRAESLVLSAGKKQERSPSAELARERARTIRLPWLSNLSLVDAVRLRDRASPSLGALRRRLARASTTDAVDVVDELRADAEEVERALVPRRGRGAQDLGLLASAIGIVVYGIVSDAALAAAASLFAAATKLRGDADAEALRQLALRTRPGYALVEARRLLEARGNGHV